MKNTKSALFILMEKKRRRKKTWGTQDEARSLELRLGLPCGCQGHKHLGHLPCFPRHINRKLDLKQTS